jgi:hypothetical protein
MESGINLTIFIVLAVVVIGILFMILRALVLWYFRIDEHIANQQRIISLLEVISTERTRNASRPVIARTDVPSAQSQNQSSALGSPPVRRPGS